VAILDDRVEPVEKAYVAPAQKDVDVANEITIGRYHVRSEMWIKLQHLAYCVPDPVAWASIYFNLGLTGFHTQCRVHFDLHTLSHHAPRLRRVNGHTLDTHRQSVDGAPNGCKAQRGHQTPFFSPETGTL
jgi:hypothetical protein